MTKYVRLRIDLNHLDAKTRALAPHFGPNGDGSAQSRTGVKLNTLYSDNNGASLPSAFTVAITLPDAVLAPHFALGTSVFAAVQAGLEFARIELARAGVLGSHNENQVGIEHVSIETAVVTYLLPFAKEYLTGIFKERLHRHALLLGLSVQSQPTRNRTTYRRNTNCTDELAFSGAAISVDQRPTQKLACLHVELDACYLKQNGWDTPESWREAYAEARYEVIFNRVVRGIFRMDCELGQHPDPDEDKYDLLDLCAAALLRDHVCGRETKSFGGFHFHFPNKEKSDMKGWRGARRSILEVTGVDINKPWQKYRFHRPAALVLQLSYPGDYHPAACDVSRRLCQENWHELLGRLRDEYELVQG